jgi:hypothetical protein
LVGTGSGADPKAVDHEWRQSLRDRSLEQAQLRRTASCRERVLAAEAKKAGIIIIIITTFDIARSFKNDSEAR